MGTGIKCAVIGKQEVTGRVFVHFGFGLQSPGVEQFAIETVTEADTDVSIPKGICQHGSEHQAE